MTATPAFKRRFTFDTDFGESAPVPPGAPLPVAPSYSGEEVEAARAAAYAEGQASAIARAEAAQAAALAELASTARAALDVLAAVAHDHRAACAGLALAVGRSPAPRWSASPKRRPWPPWKPWRARSRPSPA